MAGRILLVVAPSVVLVPLYLRLLSTVGKSFNSTEPSTGTSHVDAFLQNLDVVRHGAPTIWACLLIVTLATPALTARLYRIEPMWTVVTSFVLGTIIPAMYSEEARLVYTAPLAVGLAATFLLDELSMRPTASGVRFDRMAAAVGLIGVAYVSVVGLAYFPTQRAYYATFIPRGSVPAADWLRTNTPKDSLVAVAPIDGSPFGWWIEGLGRRPALVGSEDRWLNFPDERFRADQAVSLFSSPDPLGAGPLAYARVLHVSYLVIPWQWGGLTQADLDQFRRDHPAATVYDNQAVVIAQVPQ